MVLMGVVAIAAARGNAQPVAVETRDPIDLVRGTGLEQMLPQLPRFHSEDFPGGLMLDLVVDRRSQIEGALRQLEDKTGWPLKGSPTNAETWREYAVALAAAKRFPEAAAALSHVAGSSGGEPVVDRLLGAILAVRSGDPDAAARIAAACPDDGPAPLATICLHVAALTGGGRRPIRALLDGDLDIRRLWDPAGWPAKYDVLRVALYDLLSDRYGSIVDTRSPIALARGVTGEVIARFHKDAMVHGATSDESWSAFQVLIDIELAHDELDRASDWLDLFKQQVLDRYRGGPEDLSALARNFQEEAAVIYLRAGRTTEAQQAIDQLAARIGDEPAVAYQERMFLLADRLDVPENRAKAQHLFTAIWQQTAQLHGDAPAKMSFAERLALLPGPPRSGDSFDIQRPKPSGKIDPRALRLAAGMRLIAIFAADGDLRQLDGYHDQAVQLAAELDRPLAAPLHTQFVALATADAIRRFSTTRPRLDYAEKLARDALATIRSRFAFPAGEPSALRLAGMQLMRKLDKDERMFNESLPIGDRLKGRADRLLGRLLIARGDYDAAHPLLTEGHELYLHEFGIGSQASDYRRLTLDLADLAMRRGDMRELADWSAEAIDSQNVRSPVSPGLAEALAARARLLTASGDDYGAYLALTRAIAIQARAGRGGTRQLANYRYALAGVAERQGDAAKAVALCRSALADMIPVNRGLWTTDEKGGAELYLRSLWALHAAAFGDQQAQLSAEAFQLAQRLGESRAGGAIEAAGRRAGIADPKVQIALQQRDEAIRRRDILDARFRELFASSDAKNNRAAQAALNAEISALDGTIGRAARTGELASLTAEEEPLPIDDLAAAIGPREALAYFANAGEQMFGWVAIRRQDGRLESRWLRLSGDATALAKDVETLRCGLDFSAYLTAGADRCMTLVGLDTRPANDAGLRFRFDVAFRLYDRLFAPFADLIANRPLTIVSTGTLATLPLQVLVTVPPRAAMSDDDRDYQEAAWFGMAHAITTLPRVASLRRLPATSADALLSERVIAFGDPALDDEDGGERANCHAGTSDRGRPARTAGLTVLPVSRNGITDLVALSGTLGSVDQQVCALAAAMNPKKTMQVSVYAGPAATEANVKHLSATGALAEAGILIFATHALLPGSGTEPEQKAEEPALVLSLPRGPKSTADLEQDDGMLTASEIAELRLRSDWVILSACNTGRGADRDGEPLSGLARAFFFAGARSLMVSQWAVNAYATKQLVKTAVANLAANPAMGRAEALRRAQKTMIEGGNQPSRPSDWAPLVLVGGREEARP